jgi:hypothetical protein
VDGEVTSNLATVNLLNTAALAGQAGDVKDAEYQARKDTLARYLGPDEFASLEEVYAQFRKLREDRDAGGNIAGTLAILAENGRQRLELIQRLLKTEVDIGS